MGAWSCETKARQGGLKLNSQRVVLELAVLLYEQVRENEVPGHRVRTPSTTSSGLAVRAESIRWKSVVYFIQEWILLYCIFDRSLIVKHKSTATFCQHVQNHSLISDNKNYGGGLFITIASILQRSGRSRLPTIKGDTS